MADPEVWFRIVNINLDGPHGAPVGAYREQTVEIALGPKGAFENGNVGTLTRRVAADRVVSAIPPRRGNPKTPKKPRVVELLRKAIAWQALLESGEASSQADIARREAISRARVTQIMRLLRLTPEIQRYILAIPETIGRPTITERALRRIAPIKDQGQQHSACSQLIQR